MTQYHSYFNTNNNFIGKIPVTWSLKKIKYLGNIISGGTPSTDNDEYWNGNIPWLQSGKVQYNIIKEDDVEKYITELGFLNSSTKMVQSNSVLVAITGATCGNIGFLTFNSTINQSVIGIEPTKSYLSKFIFYFLSSQRQQILYHQSGGAQGGVNKDDVKNLFISIPNTEEQNQIVKFLDEKTELIDKLISTKERKITLLKEQRTSLINHVVTKGLNPNVKMKDSGVEWIGEIPESWSMTRVSNFGRFFKGSGIKKDEVKSEGFPCIRYGEIYTKYDRVVYTPISFINEETTKNSVTIKKGDILFTGSGETIEDIGKSILYFGEEDIYVGGDIIVLTLNQGFNPLYLSYLLNSSFIQYQKSIMGRGEIIVHIYSKNIKEIKTPIPQLSEQNQIVEFLDSKTKEIDDLVKLEQKKINLLKEYRQSLISEMVTGKIKVTN